MPQRTRSQQRQATNAATMRLAKFASMFLASRDMRYRLAFSLAAARDEGSSAHGSAECQPIRNLASRWFQAGMRNTLRTPLPPQWHKVAAWLVTTGSRSARRCEIGFARPSDRGAAMHTLMRNRALVQSFARTDDCFRGNLGGDNDRPLLAASCLRPTSPPSLC